MNPLDIIPTERELLFTVSVKPERQETQFYSVDIISGDKRIKIAQAILALSEDGEKVDYGTISARSGISVIEINEELTGCYALSEAAFSMKVRQLVAHQKLTEVNRLLGQEVQANIKTGAWDLKVQAQIRELYREIDDLEGNSSTTDPDRFLKSGADLQALDIKVEYVVDGLIPAQAVTVLYGSGGIGKTWAGLALAKAVSSGRPFFSRSTKTCPVVYVDFENSISVLIERIRKLNVRDVLFWHQYFDPKPPKLDSPEYQIYKRFPAGALIIFDTLRSAQNGDENDSQEISLVMGRSKEIRDCGFHLVLMHHTPKANERASKGSTAILDLADHSLALYRCQRGNFKPTEDDNEPAPDSIFRFGTGTKTRFQTDQIFFQRSSDGSFILADDPDKERLEAIAECIRRSPAQLTQSAIFEWAKKELEIKSKGRLTSLLSKGNGTLWTSRPEGYRRIYVPL